MLSGYFWRLQNSNTVKWGDKRMSFIGFSIDFLCDEFQIIVKSEDAADEQECLCDVHQQTVGNVVDDDDLIRHERNAAHNEQHRTGVLRDFKACVFHSFVLCHLHQRGFTCCAEDGSDDATEDLEHFSYCFVHNRNVLNGE